MALQEDDSVETVRTCNLSVFLFLCLSVCLSLSLSWRLARFAITWSQIVQMTNPNTFYANSADNKLTFFLSFPENALSHFMQIISIETRLYHSMQIVS